VRLFVAVEIESEIVHTAVTLIGELRAEVARLAPRARMTWLTPERLHLTLAFIGQCDEARLPVLRASLQSPFTVAPFTLRICGLGAFPKRGRPRVLWAGVDEGREPLMRLVDEVADRLRTLGVPLDERPQQPHLTLARVREAGGLRASALLAGREQAYLGAMTVGAITLFESRLSPAGPSYTAIARMALGDVSGQ
jgi:2'-5' RNA ligase